MDFKLGYMTVSVDLQADGFNLSVWMSTVEFWMSEQIQYPHQYTHMGDTCTWVMHSNAELTNKAIALVAETADAICKQQREINERRKLSNR